MGQQHEQQPKKEAEELKFATRAIVRELDRAIGGGEVTNMIDLLTNSVEHLMAKTQDKSMLECELKEYKEYFADLDTLRYVKEFLTELNRNCPENLKPERRYAVWER